MENSCRLSVDLTGGRLSHRNYRWNDYSFVSPDQNLLWAVGETNPVCVWFLEFISAQGKSAGLDGTDPAKLRARRSWTEIAGVSQRNSSLPWCWKTPKGSDVGGSTLMSSSWACRALSTSPQHTRAGLLCPSVGALPVPPVSAREEDPTSGGESWCGLCMIPLPFQLHCFVKLFEPIELRSFALAGNLMPPRGKAFSSPSLSCWHEFKLLYTTTHHHMENWLTKQGSPQQKHGSALEITGIHTQTSAFLAEIQLISIFVAIP